jgi:hypothetical protein
MSPEHRNASTTPSTRQTDRRSLLAKAAATGAIAWTAPAIVSERALARSTACTPKCAPADFSLQFDVETYCPGGGRKWALLRAVVSESTCPCTSNSTSRICVAPPGYWSKDGATDGIAVVPPGVRRNEFVVKKASGEGSLGDGLWTAEGSFSVAQGCLDRSGAVVWKVCEYSRVGFEFEPGGGSCAEGRGAGGSGRAQPVRCSIVCGTSLDDCPI